MRWEAGGKEGRKLGVLSNHSCPRGNHNRGTEVCEVNWKSHPDLTSTDEDTVVPNTLPSSDDRSGKIGTVYMTDTESDKCKMTMGTDSGKDADSDRNKTAVVTENKENEANGVTQREKDFSKRQEKQRDLSDEDSSNEESENECAENGEKVARKALSNINIPPDSVSDVENQLKNLAIAQSEDSKGDLFERSPMGSERPRVRCDPPYPQVSSQLRCNGGGIVAESPALTDCLYDVSPPAIVYININEFAEPNNNVLLQSGPEYPFGEASSMSEPNNNFLLPSSQDCLCGEESFPLPHLEQKDLDAWVPVDKGTTENMNDSHLGHLEVRDNPGYSNPPTIHAEQNEVCPDTVWPVSLSYRQTESIASLSPPSSGSHYSSYCSPSSSPVPSLADSVTGKSDSDTENELSKTESMLRIEYVSQSNVTSTAICGQPCYPSASDPIIYLRPWMVQPPQPLITVQSVEPLNPPVSVQSATQPAQPPNHLQQVQSATHFQLPQPPTCMQPVQSTSCMLSAQSAVRSMQQAQQAASLQQTQPPQTAISGQSRCQNIPLQSSTNTQSVISRRSVQPLPHMPFHLPNIQQGPVTPETVAISARERIATKVDKAMKDRVVMTLAKLTDDQLSKGDEHGDTQLMILIANEHQHKLEQIYVMVSRLKNIPGALIAKNAQKQSALSLSCIFLHRMPFVARFIAEVMLEKGLPVNEVDDEGNTLLHLLCAQGDSHVDILAELLSMKDSNNAPCFDINQHNYREGTPLHVAVKKHSKKVNCSRTVAFLLRQGADVLAKERSGGLTALQLAIKESCDHLLVQILLQEAERRNINLVSSRDYQGDTPLHYVALRNDMELHQQLRVFRLLVRYGAVSNCCGSRGRTPLALVSTERKHEVQKILHRR